jgi:hypothetical protein
MPTYQFITINSAEYTESGVVLVNYNEDRSILIDPGHDGWDKLQEWVAEGNEIAPYVPPPEPTNEELIDMAGPVLVAFIKAYAKREGLTLAQVRNALIAEM